MPSACPETPLSSPGQRGVSRVVGLWKLLASRGAKNTWPGAVVLVVLLLATALSVCIPAGGGGDGQRQVAGTDWPVFGRTSDNTRFSPLDQINETNVGQLHLAWERGEGFGQATWESFPLVVGRRMYVTTNTDQVLALDAGTGAVRWAYTPKVNFLFGVAQGGSYFPTNRGVAVAGRRVYELTFDDHLLSLDTKTGKLLWRVAVADPHLGYYETSAPTVADGLVFVGSSGGDAGVRGFVAAYRASTGRQVWRRYTVPAPGHGWVPATGHHGGGAVWMPPTIGAATGVLYFGTGNPSPNYSGAVRPGPDPYTSGIMALRARTGKMLWFAPLVPHDVSDLDPASPVVLFDVHRGGRTIPALGEAGKSGRWVVLHAATGKKLHPPVAFVYGHRPVPVAGGILQCPGELGGSNYSPVAYSPLTHAAYVSGINYCTVVHRAPPPTLAGHRPDQPDLGGTVEPAGARPTGTFSAIDVESGRFLWKRSVPAPMLGGATATGGGLVFAGDTAGTLYAFSARSGRILWRRSLGSGLGSAPIVYAVGGREHLAVVSGGAAISAINLLGPVGARLLVFTLPDSKGR